MTNPLDLMQLRNAFPILQESANGHPLVYLDNAATTQKPLSVIKAIEDYYHYQNANVHRASHYLSNLATQQFEQARASVQQFINAKYTSEVVWTKGTTESINLIAQSYGRTNLKEGDEILISLMEHHANIVPWQILSEQTGAILKVVPLTPENQLDLQAFDTLLSEKTKIVSICQASNSVGTINPIKALIRKAKDNNAISVIDGAQAIAHLDIDVQDLDCDFYCFSGHKMFGPTGIGVLYGKKALLESMPPWQSGGEMIQRVSFTGTTFNDIPFKFEAGTPNIAGAIGLSAAINFLEQWPIEARIFHENSLLSIALQRAKAIPQLTLVPQGEHNVSLMAFNVKHYHASDIGTLLDQQGIAVRTGHHCTMPLMEHLHLDGSIRVSFSFYNTEEEVHRCFDNVEKIIFSHSNKQKSETKNTPLTQTLPHIDELVKNILSKKGWESRYRFIMQLGKKLPILEEKYRTNENLVPGCDSTVWIAYTESNGTLEFSIDSNARIIRGLSAILISYYSHKSPNKIIDDEDSSNGGIQHIFEILGLNKHLNPSRSNGLRAINQRIIDIAQQQAANNSEVAKTD